MTCVLVSQDSYNNVYATFGFALFTINSDHWDYRFLLLLTDLAPHLLREKTFFENYGLQLGFLEGGQGGSSMFFSYETPEEHLRERVGSELEGNLDEMEE